MRFVVERTSSYGLKKPCKEAREEKVKSYFFDSYECKNRKEKIENKWVVDLNNLQEILDFVKKYQKVVIENDGWYELPVIEIYDSWREE